MPEVKRGAFLSLSPQNIWWDVSSRLAFSTHASLCRKIAEQKKLTSGEHLELYYKF